MQFQDPDFGGLSGGRVVRIAVHPDYQGVNILKPIVSSQQWYHVNGCTGRAKFYLAPCIIKIQ